MNGSLRFKSQPWDNGGLNKDPADHRRHDAGTLMNIKTSIDIRKIVSSCCHVHPDATMLGFMGLINLICLDPQFSKRLRLSGYHTDGLSLELCGFLGGCQYGRASSNAAPSKHGLPSRTGSGWNLWFLGLENLEWPGRWATRLSCRVRGFRYWRHRGCLVCLILKDNHNLKHTLRVLGFLMSIFCSYISKSSMFWSQSPPVNRPSLQNYVICRFGLPSCMYHFCWPTVGGWLVTRDDVPSQPWFIHDHRLWQWYCTWHMCVWMCIYIYMHIYVYIYM